MPKRIEVTDEDIEKAKGLEKLNLLVLRETLRRARSKQR